MGPLAGYRIIEFAGIGPAPFAAMMLADLGAEVICIERSAGDDPAQRVELSRRGKRSIALNLKSPAGIAVVLQLLETADALIEGFRPGVMERLGLGPDVCLGRNPKLVYGRMTGWGQHGPLAHTAGHDINYIALTGALFGVGLPDQKPVPPLNLVGDFGGGGMLLNVGLLAALLEASRSGRGQVVDAAMTDGSALLMTMFHSLTYQGRWNPAQRGVNLLDGGAHFYDTYETSDGRYVALGPIEPQFYAELLARLGLDAAEYGGQHDASRWPLLKAKLRDVFLSNTRDHWCSLLEGSDACFAPILSMNEAPQHPHNAARQTYIEQDGLVQPAPAPRFDRTVPEAGRIGVPGADTEAVLAELGFDADRLAALRSKGALG